MRLPPLRLPRHRLAVGGIACTVVLLAATVLLVIPSRPARGVCFCAPVVYDPTNHATALEQLARSVTQVEELTSLVEGVQTLHEAVGLAGELTGLADLPGLADTFIRELPATIDDLTAQALQIIDQGLGLSATLAGIAPVLDTVTELVDTGAATARAVDGAATDVDQLLHGGGGRHLLNTVSGATAVTRQLLSAVGPLDAASAQLLHRRRHAELREALEQGHAIAWQSLATASRAPARVAQLSRAAGAAQNEREQLAVLGAVLMATTEELAAQRAAIAALVRLQAAREFANRDVVAAPADQR